LSEPLLIYVLRRLEQLPKTIFWATDLKARSAEDFEQLRSSGLLRFVRQNP